MEKSNKKRARVIAIVGATGSGKSALAVRIAKKIQNAEIISADSRQVYRGLDLLSNKITPKEMGGVPHHMINVASPKRVYSVASYEKKARSILRDILRRGKTPIICGGTGLYVDALLYPSSIPPVPPNPRLRKKLEKLGVASLYALLKQKDPRRAGTIDPHNPRRLIRALEIIEATGKPVPRIEKQKSPYDILVLGIRIPREDLLKKLEKRNKEQIKKGMLEEAKRLRTEGISSKRMREIGLWAKIANAHLEKKIPKELFESLLLKETLAYAKRQETWWRKNTDIQWIKTEAEALRLIR
jgi:tRNA dimethylallyltransferase